MNASQQKNLVPIQPKRIITLSDRPNSVYPLKRKINVFWRGVGEGLDPFCQSTCYAKCDRWVAILIALAVLPIFRA
ncbi:hypothetical protein D3C85_1765690 [compost metagenome]